MEAFFKEDQELSKWVDLFIEKLVTVNLLSGNEAESEFYQGRQAVERIAAVFQEMFDLPREVLVDGIRQLVEQRLPDPRVIENFPDFYQRMNDMILAGLKSQENTEQVYIPQQIVNLKSMVSNEGDRSVPSSIVSLKSHYGKVKDNPILLTTDKESVSKESVNKESANNEYAGKEINQMECAGRESVNMESTNMECINMESINMESINMESINMESANKESAKKSTINESINNGFSLNPIELAMEAEKWISSVEISEETQSSSSEGKSPIQENAEIERKLDSLDQLTEPKEKQVWLQQLENQGVPQHSGSVAKSLNELIDESLKQLLQESQEEIDEYTMAYKLNADHDAIKETSQAHDISLSSPSREQKVKEEAEDAVPALSTMTIYNLDIDNNIKNDNKQEIENNIKADIKAKVDNKAEIDNHSSSNLWNANIIGNNERIIERVNQRTNLNRDPFRFNKQNKPSVKVAAAPQTSISQQMPQEGKILDRVLKQLYGDANIEWKVNIEGYTFLAKVDNLLIYVTDNSLPMDELERITGNVKALGYKVFVCSQKDLLLSQRLERGIRRTR